MPIFCFFGNRDHVCGNALIAGWAIPEAFDLRSADGQLTACSAPLMKAIVPLIFVIFVTLGVVYAERYMKSTGIGSLVALMMPYWALG